MTIRYLDNNEELVTDSTVTKIEPVINGSKILITATTNFTIPLKNLVEITSV